MQKAISFFLHNRLVTAIVLLLLLLAGLVFSPFNWQLKGIPQHPISVDAIPNTGENQQLIFTDWNGRSPQDIDDQITYPLTTYLLGVPGVKSVRSSSMMGFSIIYLIFEEEVDFYWSRSRILEKLSALPATLLPEGVKPSLGPDATALGQVFWYTIEPQDKQGNPTGGWDLHEIRSVQDFYVKYALSSAEGIAEVASIGGFVKEYQVDVRPDVLRQYNIGLEQVAKAIQNANRDTGAKTIEINQAEYVVRGLGYIQSIDDIEEAVVSIVNNTPIRLRDVAEVFIGPAERRGVLDKNGAEAVGGVVVARDGYNPLKAIQNVQQKIAEIQPGLATKMLPDGTESKLQIVPFYDRSELIYETIATLEDAISLQMLIAVLVVIVLLFNLRASLAISSVLPIAVLMVFIGMMWLDIEANIVALSGIAIAIGTMIDLAVILVENISKHLTEVKTKNNQIRLQKVEEATLEVSGAILTAVATTVVSFIPVFLLENAEGKLFVPLAYTKTFALLASCLVTLFILPSIAYVLLGMRVHGAFIKWIKSIFIGIISLVLFGYNEWFFGALLLGLTLVSSPVLASAKWSKNVKLSISLLGIVWLLTSFWLPLGPSKAWIVNFLFVVLCIGLILAAFFLLERYYTQLLSRCLANVRLFLLLPVAMIFIGIVIWLGFARVFYVPKMAFHTLGWEVEETHFWTVLDEKLPGIGKEFMPSLDEGSFLLMPTTMPHSGVAYNVEVLQNLDLLTSQIPEVSESVGKLGRVESALDPAPISMFENVINYKPEFIRNERGRKIKFKVNSNGSFVINEKLQPNNTTPLFFSTASFQLVNEANEALPNSVQDELLPVFLASSTSFLMEDEKGVYFRNWRPAIKTTDDIWNEIAQITKLPGVTSAPKLQPIETRQIMLQTGMRAPMGIKVFGTTLEEIERFGIALEQLLREVPSLRSSAVNAERIEGKPYLHLRILRDQIALYGLSVEAVQQHIEMAIGGMPMTTTLEGRERYQVRIRYPRELRSSPEDIANILVDAPNGNQVSLGDLVEISYHQGPTSIKSENTFLVGYVFFDKQSDVAEITAVNEAKKAIFEAIDNGNLQVPNGMSFEFAGNYQNQLRAEQRLSLIIPIVLLLIFLILYLQFRSVSISLMVFLSIALAFSGGFMLIQAYANESFLNLSIFGENLREIFQLRKINLSVAVWVGFIALFGIATDDAVLMATYLKQSFQKRTPAHTHEIKQAIIAGAQRRIKPAVMTSATTIIALLPVLTSSGKGSEIMQPMAIPAFGGMIMASVTYFLLPCLFYLYQRRKINIKATSA